RGGHGDVRLRAGLGDDFEDLCTEVGALRRVVEADVDREDVVAADGREETGLHERRLAPTGKRKEDGEALPLEVLGQVGGFFAAPLEPALIGLTEGEQTGPRILRADHRAVCHLWTHKSLCLLARA